METFLNLVWLAITLASVWLWRFRWIVSRKNPRHSTRMEAAAMVCILALLFPVISLTDDLHPETMAVDAASGKRNARLIAATAHQARAATQSPLTHLTIGPTSESSAVTGWIVSEIASPSQLNNPRFVARDSFGRSPPVLL
jgi:hypothetical protein